ncbi:hypothetical protein JZU71_03440, partial [bacterium]|nr:hypothetical protein [bacterium]
GIVRVGAFQKLNDYPAAVIIAISKQTAFYSIVNSGDQYRIWGAMFAAVLWSLLLFLCWQLRKIDQARATLRQVNENLECKVEGRTQEIQAVNQEMTAQNEELAALNQTIRKMNEGLEQLVEERTAD